MNSANTWLLSKIELFDLLKKKLKIIINKTAETVKLQVIFPSFPSLLSFLGHQTEKSSTTEPNTAESQLIQIERENHRSAE